MYLETFILLVDNDCPPVFREGLRGDVGAQIENLGQTEKRAFGVFDGVDNVVSVRGHTGFATEVSVGIAKLARFEGLWVFCLQLVDIDVL